MILNQFLAVKSWKRRAEVCAVVLAMAVTLFSQTTQRTNRITKELTSGLMVTIPGTVHPLTRRATDMGAVDTEMQLPAMTLNIGLSAAQQMELNTLIEAQQNPKSPLYHKWLTQEEFGARFGLTDADLNAVTGWLKGQGFKVKGASRSRNAIHFSGTAGQVESAFQTQLRGYESYGEQHIANATELRVPEEIAGVVQSVRGLDNFRPRQNIHQIAVPSYTVDTTNGLMYFLTPADWATIYDLNPMYNAGYDGTGIHVGVVGQTWAPPDDISNFCVAKDDAGYCSGPTYACISTADCADTAGISPGDWTEADLDVEWAGGIARGAWVDYVYAAGDDNTQNVFDALQYAIQTYKSASGLVLPVISMSYTTCETELPLAQAELFDSMGKQASVQGQTLVVSSGDSGPAGCDAHDSSSVTSATKGISAGAPPDSPNFTAVGGTQFSGDVTEPSLYWNQGAGIVDSALSYIPETSWNETGMNGLDASGGGQSTLLNGSTLEFPLPSWQSGLISWAKGRLIPDIAFTAAEHDGYMGCSGALDSGQYGEMCTNGFYSSGGTDGSVFYSFSGTSLAAPSFAGMLGMIVQALGPQGNINPMLYQLAAGALRYRTIFHDITTGNNDVPCRTGTNGCVNGVMGYAAAKGYDLVTGLGSVDADALFQALGGSNLKPTATSVSESLNLLRLGDTVIFTAYVSPTIDRGGSLEITGNVTFKVGNTVLGTVAASSGWATLSNVLVSTANGFSNGTDTITASYSGDSTYGPSAGTATLTVSATPIMTSITVSTTPSEVRLGDVTTISAGFNFPAYTVAPTLTGSMTFMVGSTTLGTTVLSSGVTPPLVNVLVSTANGFSNGTDTITASYSGDSNFAASSGTTTLTVLATPWPTTILANYGAMLPLFSEGSATSFAATVTSTGIGTPSGTVTFTTGTATLGTVTLGALNASTQLSNVLLTSANGLGVGTDTVTISYSGDANFLPSTTSFLVTVYDTVFPLLSPIEGANPLPAGGDMGASFFMEGANFTPNSVALWNGAARPTTYYSSTLLIITLSIADLAQEGTYLITVANPAPNAGTSSAQPVAVQSSPPVAKISGVSVAVAADGSGNRVVALTGTDFSPDPVVQWNGTSLPTTYLSPWQISATITALQYAALPATLTVVNQWFTTTSAPFVLH